jgi:hypothetical protein
MDFLSSSRAAASCSIYHDPEGVVYQAGDCRDWTATGRGGIFARQRGVDYGWDVCEASWNEVLIWLPSLQACN